MSTGSHQAGDRPAAQSVDDTWYQSEPICEGELMDTVDRFMPPPSLPRDLSPDDDKSKTRR